MLAQELRDFHRGKIWGHDPLRARDSARLELVVIAWAFAAVYIYTLQVILPGYKSAFGLFDEILSGTAPSPYAYRILVPLLIKGLGIPFTYLLKLKAQTAFCAGYIVYSFAAIEFSAWMLFRLAAHHDVFQPWSQLEPGLYAAAIILAVKGRGAWVLPLTIVASFNRETGLFVPLLFCAALSGRWFDRRRIFWLSILEAVWLAIFWGLRMTIGMSADRYTIAYCWNRNLVPGSIDLTIGASAAFLSIILPAVFGARYVPREIRRCALILPLFVPVTLLFGMWWEVRHWLPLTCILLPYAVSGLRALLSKGVVLSEETDRIRCDESLVLSH